MQASGTSTLLFTDIEDSSRAWLRDQRAMGAATARHDELIEHRVAQHALRSIAYGGQVLLSNITASSYAARCQRTRA